jgi:hypothetical protein
LVPRGTESPSATTDHARGGLDEPVDADEFDCEDEEHAAATQLSATRTTTPEARRHRPPSISYVKLYLRRGPDVQ